MSAAQADQEARRAAEMVLAILGERVDHGEGAGEGAVKWSLLAEQPVFTTRMRVQCRVSQRLPLMVVAPCVSGPPALDDDESKLRSGHGCGADTSASGEE